MALKLGIPKGSLQDATVQLFRGGLQHLRQHAIILSSVSTIRGDRVHCLIRAQEVARYVADGVIDAGLTGQELRSLARIGHPEDINILDLVYSEQSFGKVRWARGAGSFGLPRSCHKAQTEVVPH